MSLISNGYLMESLKTKLEIKIMANKNKTGQKKEERGKKVPYR